MFKRFKIRYIDYECLAFYNLTEFRTHFLPLLWHSNPAEPGMEQSVIL
jgi:hypothetical protein